MDGRFSGRSTAASNQTDRERRYRRFSPLARASARFSFIVRKTTWTIWTWLVVQAKRLFDIACALLFLVLLSPVWLLILVAWIPARIRLDRVERQGKFSRPFHQYYLSSPKKWAQKRLQRFRLEKLPLLLNLLRGDVSLVGPRLTPPGDFNVSRADVRIRFDVAPGFLGLWGLRKKTSIDFGTEVDSDKEYVETRSFWGDLGIVVRTLLASLYGSAGENTAGEVNILGIPLQNYSMEDVLDWVSRKSATGKPHQICFVNPHCANVAYEDPDYLRVLQSADLCLVDGIGMRIAGKLLKNEIRQNVNGTDLFPRLCQRASELGLRLYLLGAKPGVSGEVAEWVRSNHPGVLLAGHEHGYLQDEDAAISRIRQSETDVLLVAMGVPHQDKWIARNLDRLGVGVAMGVGGLFDFYSGRMPRAPQWLRELGLEWLFRLYQEPGRMWKRYIVGNTIFLMRVFRSKLSSRERVVQ